MSQKASISGLCVNLNRQIFFILFIFFTCLDSSVMAFRLIMIIIMMIIPTTTTTTLILLIIIVIVIIIVVVVVMY